MTHADTAVLAVTPRPVGIRVAVSLCGALLVAAAAQISFVMPGTVIPFTLQPLAVLIVGGLLGPRYGALSLLMYLGMGSLGLPVFTPVGLAGIARLFGPTGGYLLAYPVAAAVTGWTVRRLEPYAFGGALIACALGMVVIHLGGSAQLMILTGSPAGAFAIGVLPFLLNDLVKAAVAALVIRSLFRRRFE